MRIAQVAPLYESVPPALYGGTERVVSYLTEELVRQGHEVTLFASGDSTTAAKLIAPCKRALRLDPDCQDSLAYHMIMLEEVFRRAHDFDVVHFHIDYLHFPVSRRTRVPNITTLHGRLDLPEHGAVYRQFPDMPLISISNAQREPLPNMVSWRATVYHGLPDELYRFEPRPGKYLAFIGRISPEKGLDRAIEAAIRTGMPIRIAAKVDKVDRAYFEATIKPMLDHPLVEYIGEIGEGEKQEFLGGAYALMFLIDWPEPFGLAMIEALACGTPVIAFRRGSVPEVIDDGTTGFIVSNVDEAVEAILRVAKLNRADCRKAVDGQFSSYRMAKDYLIQYAGLQTEDPLLSEITSHAPFR
ncbi:MAG TPA: glycosyltransferase family 4 protein [Bryobacteraceae bacterium]|nr:glycosyltransferase family 4 protein [Bryobacteraceae bacterium]